MPCRRPFDGLGSAPFRASLQDLTALPDHLAGGYGLDAPTQEPYPRFRLQFTKLGAVR